MRERGFPKNTLKNWDASTREYHITGSRNLRGFGRVDNLTIGSGATNIKVEQVEPGDKPRAVASIIVTYPTETMARVLAESAYQNITVSSKRGELTLRTGEEIPQKGDFTQVDTDQMEVVADETSITSNITVYLPPKDARALHITSDTGDILLSRQAGEAEVKSRSGKVSFFGHVGNAVAETETGAVLAYIFNGDLKATSTTGTIVTQITEGALHLSSVDGYIRAEAAAIVTPSEILTGKGNIDVTPLNEDLLVHISTNGETDLPYEDVFIATYEGPAVEDDGVNSVIHGHFGEGAVGHPLKLKSGTGKITLRRDE